MPDLNKIIDNLGKRIDVGNLFVSRGDIDGGMALFESAIDVDPTCPVPWANGAFLLLKKQERERALLWVTEALRLDPNNAHACMVRAMIHMDALEFEQSAAMFEKSLEINPKDQTTMLNYAYMLQLIGNFRRGLDVYTVARSLNPTDPSIRFQRAMCGMTIAKTKAEWEEFLNEYETRHMQYFCPRPEGKTLYHGQVTSQANGDSLLITTEQGLGDAVMTGRYVRFVKQHRFKHVYILTKPEWQGLLSKIEGVDGVYKDISEVPEFTHYTPAMSLLRVCDHPFVPVDNKPYLVLPATARGPKDTVSVGLCWKGNPSHGNDRWRSIGADMFLDAFDGIPGAKFYSIQKSDETDMHRRDFVLNTKIDTPEGLAEVISKMDLVVTVDTAPLHIAGSLGVPAFGLIASNPDWRWSDEGEWTSWYPSVRLFRAKKPLEWGPVLDAVSMKTKQFISNLNKKGKK